MFGLKRKKNLPTPLLSSIAKKVVYSMSEDDNEIKKGFVSRLPRLPFGSKPNDWIDVEYLNKIPLRERMYWPWLDFNKIFADEIREASKPVIPTSDNKFVQIGIKANEPVSVIETALEFKKNNELQLSQKVRDDD